MALVDLAAQGEGACESLQAISARQSISVSFLEQIFGKLRRAGMVESQRGASGGYALTAAPSALTLDKIIFAVHEDIKAHGCTPEAKVACTGGTDRCLTHNLWGALEGHIESFFANVTLQDVIDGRFTPTDARAELEAAE